jgi:osmotically-inducible protein OsmY
MEDVGPVPVVADNPGRRLLGIITDRDIAVKVVAAGLDARSTRIGDVMSKNLVTCRADEDYSEALNAMARHQIRRIPVVNEDGSIAGIISQADVARRVAEEEVGEMVEEISEPAGLRHMVGSMSSSFRSRGRGREASGVAAQSVLLSGAAFLTLGAAVMYVLDPARGRTRRAKLRDKAASLFNDSAHYAGKVQRDLQNRATGAVASAKSKLKGEEELSDQKLEARVRSSLGRATSHPHAIRVRVDNGCVTLDGNVLKPEVRNVLSAVRSVPGVKAVQDQLHTYDTGEHVPDLQGGRPRQGQKSELMQSNWSPATRFLASAVGGGLVLYGMRAGGPAAKATASVGACLLTRGIANKEVTSLMDMVRTPSKMAPGMAT